MIRRSLVSVAAISLAFTAGASAADLTAGSPTADLVPAVQNPEMHQLSGYVELYGQALWNFPDSDGNNVWLGGGVAARANVWWHPNWSSQFDLSGNISSPSQDPSGNGSVTAATGAAHFDWRDPSKGLLGGFIGLASTNDCCGTGQDLSGFAGVEGQYYWNHFTLYGQGGLLHQFSGTYGGPGDTGETIDIGFVQATARFFPHPNTKIEGSIGYMTGPIWGSDYSPSYVAHAITFAAEIEHRFDNHPISIFARVSGFSDPNYTSGPSLEYAVMGGIKVNFGTGTLEEQDRNGATLKVPDFDPIGWLRWDD